MQKNQLSLMLVALVILVLGVLAVLFLSDTTPPVTSPPATLVSSGSEQQATGSVGEVSSSVVSPARMEATPAQAVVEEKIDPVAEGRMKFSDLSPESGLRRLLMKAAKERGIVLGPDFTLDRLSVEDFENMREGVQTTRKVVEEIVSSEQYNIQDILEKRGAFLSFPNTDDGLKEAEKELAKKDGLHRLSTLSLGEGPGEYRVFAFRLEEFPAYRQAIMDLEGYEEYWPIFEQRAVGIITR